MDVRQRIGQHVVCGFPGTGRNGEIRRAAESYRREFFLSTEKIFAVKRKPLTGDPINLSMAGSEAQAAAFALEMTVHFGAHTILPWFLIGWLRLRLSRTPGSFLYRRAFRYSRKERIADRHVAGTCVRGGAYARHVGKIIRSAAD